MGSELRTSDSPAFALGERRLSDRIAHYLRDLIIAGELPPGAKIREVEIATRLGVSRAPVREAILQLERGNLVETEPHRGATVRQIDQTMLREISEVRTLLEGAVALEFSRHGGEQPGVVALNNCVEDMRSAAAERDRTKLAAAHTAFHRTFIDAAQNRALAQVLSSLWDQTITFLDVIHGRYARGDMKSIVVDRHETLLQAILSGDDDAVNREMRRHASVPER